ncbi:MAG TPA: RNA ligase family protein [Humisphaera sp.]|nr:RNA ligase family protein [Humisphaera sp.]
MAGKSLVDPSRMQMLFGSYAVGKAAAMADPFVPLKAQEYRRNLAARMMALDKASAKEKLPACDCLVSRKMDGECTLLSVSADDCCSVNPGGVVRSGLPFMREAVELLGKTKHKQMLLAGELYVARSDRRPRVHDVSRVARQPQSQDELDQLQFAVFDILDIDDKPAPSAYSDVYKKIDSVFKSGKRVHPVETVRAKTLDDVLKHFEKWVEAEGAEGVVIRSDSAGQFKIKPRISLDVAVLGFTEGTDDRAGMVHDMLVGLMRQDNSFHILGRVGGGISEDERREWLSDLKDMSAESNYAEVNDSVAYQMVRPEWVIEMSCLDLINQNTRGSSIDRMVLGFDQPNNSYQSIRRLPLASPISPVFVRRREDKSIRHADLRLHQVSQVVEVPMMDRDARQLAHPKSELLVREVFTKTLKGNLMVRKLLLWKTNKESEGGNFPAYVAYYTDFSPNRAAPLERDIRVSNSLDQIKELLGAMKGEYIVKGWAPA